jgi:hypothetical protein
MYLLSERNCAIAQAVSRRLPTAATQVLSQVRLCGICGGQSGTGAGLLPVLRFPLPILIPPTTPLSSSIIRGWYNRAMMADVRCGLSLTPPQETKKKKKMFSEIHVSVSRTRDINLVAGPPSLGR